MAASKVLSTRIPYAALPENYIRPESDRPNLSQVINCEDIPLIDLNYPDKAETIRRISDACQHFGFFQVINHGISIESTEGMLKIARQFFHLPLDEKKKFYSDDPTKTMRLSTSFNVEKETIHNWRDYLRLHCHPLEQFLQDWPSVPPSFKNEIREYNMEVRRLTSKLLEVIMESSGSKREYETEIFDKHGQHMAMNYSLPCHETKLAYGVLGHTDANVFTVLLQGDDFPSDVQVLHKGKRVVIHPIPNTFIVNMGDQLQLHRNDDIESISNQCNLHCVDIIIKKNGHGCDRNGVFQGRDLQEATIDRNEPQQPTTNQDYGNTITSFFQRNEIGKMAMACIPPALVTLLMNKTTFPSLILHLVIITFSIGFVCIWNGLMLRDLFQRFGCAAEQVGVLIVFLSLFLLVGSVLPLQLVWAPILCGFLILLPFILHFFPSYNQKQMDGTA